jgi:hypothetical protein
VCLASWTVGARLLHQEAKVMHGTLVHCALALPDARSHLVFLSCFAATLSSAAPSFTCWLTSLPLLSDIAFWHKALHCPFYGLLLRNLPLAVLTKFWVDALTLCGTGIVFDSQWQAWQLAPGWKIDGCDIGWAEMLAIKLGLWLVLTCSFQDTHFLICSNNMGIIGTLEVRHLHNLEHNRVLQHIVVLMHANGLWFTLLYVTSATNLLDHLSRGLPAVDSPCTHPHQRLPGRKAACTGAQQGDGPSCLASHPPCLAVAHAGHNQTLDTATACCTADSTGGPQCLGPADNCWAQPCVGPLQVHLPVSELVICAFTASHLGTALGAMAHNNIAGVQARHMAIGAPWHNRPWLKLVLKGAECTQPASSRRPKQPPTTVDHLQALDNVLTDSLFNCAIFAAMCIAFWGIFQMGKLLLGLIKWDPTFIPTQAAWMQGPETNIIHLPWTKTKHLLSHPVPIIPQCSHTCTVLALHAYMHMMPAPASTPPSATHMAPQQHCSRSPPACSLTALTPSWHRSVTRASLATASALAEPQTYWSAELPWPLCAWLGAGTLTASSFTGGSTTP